METFPRTATNAALKNRYNICISYGYQQSFIVFFVYQVRVCPLIITFITIQFEVCNENHLTEKAINIIYL